MNRLINKSVVLIIFVMLSMIAPQFADAATYYISPSGSNSNSGTQSQPFATFSHAFSQMSGGDTLYVMDGTYNEQVKDMPSGSPGAAEIDGQGSIPATYDSLLLVDNKSYVEIRGLRVHDSKGTVCRIDSSDNIIFRVMACWHAGGSYYNTKSLQITGSNDDVLVEDSWAFGRARSPIEVRSGSGNVVLRRVVSRFDDGAYQGEPISGVKFYKASNAIVDNAITFDHSTDYSVNTEGHYGFRVISRTAPYSSNNRMFGTIAMNVKKTAYALELKYSTGGGEDNYFKDCVSVDNPRGIQFHGDKHWRSTVENCNFINNGGYGIFNGGGTEGNSVKNTLVMNSGSTGIKENGGSNFVVSYIGSYNNQGDLDGVSCTTGCRTDNPGLLYPTRIESNSPYKGAGENGADIGANIIYRYQNGVLTNQALWPWPYENWIKEDMCDPDILQNIGRTGSDIPKWCTTNKTLTEYVWEYLGNSCPGNICNYNDPVPAPPTNLRIISPN
jgi:hypothetical protein